MKVTRAQILDSAFDMLRTAGLSGLSMRRLAQDLGVQPGALYYHVASKQELLAAIAERVLDDFPTSAANPRGVAQELRAALLRVRDGAEVISFVQAFRPDALTPTQTLYRLFVEQLGPRQAGWAARTVIHYVLGFVAEEQNRAELVRAHIVDDEPARDDESAEAFRFGIDAILNGLAGARENRSAASQARP